MLQDFFGLLMGARIEDTNGDELTDLVEIRYTNNKLTLVFEAVEDEEDGDPDDGEHEPVVEQQAKVRAIAGGKK